MRLLHPLRSANMALLWGGMTLSAVGDQLYAVALSWIAVTVFGAGAGYLTALQAGMVLLAALGLGRWADRWGVSESLIGADLVRAVALFGLVASWLALGVPTALPLIVAVAVLAAGQAVFQPAMQSILPHMVPDRALLPAANALMDATDRSARLLGPGLIALLAGLVPTVHFLSLDALSFLVSAAALALIRRRTRLSIARPTGLESGRESIRASIARGWRAMSVHPLLGYLLRATPVLNGAWYTAYFLALPLLIEQRGVQGPGGSGLGAYGVVIASYGCASVVINLVLGGRPMPARPQLRMFGGNLTVGFGTFLLALAAFLPPDARLPAIAASAALAAIGGPMKDILTAVLRQTRIPPADMAASMRAYIAAGSSGSLLGMLAAPVLLHLLGPVTVIMLCAALMAATGAVGLARQWQWREDA